MNVVLCHRDSRTFEARTEPPAEHSTGSPIEVDRLDVLGASRNRLGGLHNLFVVQLDREKDHDRDDIEGSGDEETHTPTVAASGRILSTCHS